LYATVEEIDDISTPMTKQRNTNNDKDRLVFQSSFDSQSNMILPTIPDSVSLESFFTCPVHLTFGKSLPSQIIPITPELLKEWTVACEKVGAGLPEIDIIISTFLVSICMVCIVTTVPAVFGIRRFNTVVCHCCVL
jgi:hypothetical protein